MAAEERYLDFVVTDGGRPGPESTFVELEDQDGRGVGIGEWVQRDNGLWALRIRYADLEELLAPRGFV
jgi:hypothetical protein